MTPDEAREALHTLTPRLYSGEEIANLSDEDALLTAEAHGLTTVEL